MNRYFTPRRFHLKLGAIFFFFFYLLVISGDFPSYSACFNSWFRAAISLVRDSEVELECYLCLAVYFGISVYCRSCFRHLTKENLLLAYVVLISGIKFSVCLPRPDTGLSFFAFIVFGHCFASLSICAHRRILSYRLVSLLVIIGVTVSVLKMPVSGYLFQNGARWSGFWDNPNTYGLLMGTAAVLAVGLARLNIAERRNDEVEGVLSGIPGLEAEKLLRAIFCLVSAGFIGRALLHSYSRGAWCGAAAGVAFLGSQPLALWFGRGGRGRQAERNGNGEDGVKKMKWRAGFATRSHLPLVTVLVSVAVLCFWGFRATEWKPARRMFSVTKSEDFSWRNRVAAWEGALQITAEHLLFGAGWEQPEPLYHNFYLPPRLSESAAIQMNDYLMVGATLGMPTLFCFFAYIWLTLAGKEECRMKNEELGTDFAFRSPTLDFGLWTLDWQRRVCHAGAIVLLVGFWFDGGLFKLPTAATFWILLELGAVQPQSRVEEAKSLTAE